MAIQKISGVTIELTSQASGDVAYFDGTDWVRLAKGEPGEVLTMNESVTAPEWGQPLWTFPGTVKGYCAAGNTAPAGGTNITAIDRWSFTTDANSTNVGDVIVGRSHQSGQSSSTHGYISGSGHIAQPINNTIDRWSFATEGNAVDHGDLAIASGQGTSHSSETHGYHVGGNNGPQGGSHTYINSIQKFPFASTGSTNNATDVADLTVTRSVTSGATSSTHGYSAGGEAGAPWLNTIDKFTLASDNNATDVGDVGEAAESHSGTSSLTHGYIAGGVFNQNGGSIRKYSFATDGDSTNTANLTADRHGHTGCSSETFGYSAAGYNAGGGGAINIIEKYSVTTDSDATDVGDLAGGVRWFPSPVGSQV